MSHLLKDKRIALLGLGKMGGILVEAFLEKKLVSPDQLRCTVRHEDRAHRLGERFGIEVTTDNVAACHEADLILLGLKPRTVSEVCRQIEPVVGEDQLVVSFAASVPTALIEETLGRVPVVRAMPNTPCVLGFGMTGLCRGRFARDEHLALTEHLFEAVGRTVCVDERQMDAVTGLSASGPAFLYVILESLAEAGVKVGLERETATLLAAQTALGASQMVLQTGDHPALLKDAVTTPAGCTIDGLLELEEGKLRVTLIKAVVKAAERARQLVEG